MTDTKTMVLTTCYYEQKEHVCDARDTEHQEKAGTQEVENQSNIIRESLANNTVTPRTQVI